MYYMDDLNNYSTEKEKGRERGEEKKKEKEKEKKNGVWQKAYS